MKKSVRTQMVINDQQLLLIFSFPFTENFVRQEFLQSFAYFSILQSSDVFYCSRSRSEPMKGF